MTSACFRRCLRTSPPSFASSTLIVSTLSPAWLKTVTSIMTESRASVLLAFLRDAGRDALANEKERSVRSRERSFDEQQVVGGVDLHERVVARRDLVHAHVPGHANALLGLAALAAPRGVRRERAGRAVLALGAVRRGLTTEVV